MDNANLYGDLNPPTPADWNADSEETASPFNDAVDHVLMRTAEVARHLVGAHQSAAALILNGDWKGIRKYFSLSSRYADWYDYRTPAVGIGIHATILTRNQPMRFTQAELEAHPDWKGFGTQADTHPPMRGWLAVPLIAPDDHRNFGMLQLSDKYDGDDFNEEDETRLVHLAELTALALSALCKLHDNQLLGH
jgi:GAF domain-containing protein